MADCAKCNRPLCRPIPGRMRCYNCGACEHCCVCGKLDTQGFNPDTMTFERDDNAQPDLVARDDSQPTRRLAPHRVAIPKGS